MQRTIILAGISYALTVPLTLQQLIDCNVGMELPAGESDGGTTARIYERQIRVLSAALRAEYPELTEEKLRTMRGITIAEFNAASRVIYEENELIPRAKDEAAGEAEA